MIEGAGILPHLRAALAALQTGSEPDHSVRVRTALTEALWWGDWDECCLSQASARDPHILALLGHSIAVAKAHAPARLHVAARCAEAVYLSSRRCA